MLYWILVLKTELAVLFPLTRDPQERPEKAQLGEVVQYYPSQIGFIADRNGQRSTLNLWRAETSSRWCGMVVRREVPELRCRPRHLTMVQNYVVRRQKPSYS
ncbi:uncharacterized protein TNCV_3843781 [Trichonephila clavipes]|nr:uncharacterized protein TNCV_3843781 [Trichonephila clavipes]